MLGKWLLLGLAIFIAPIGDATALIDEGPYGTWWVEAPIPTADAGFNSKIAVGPGGDVHILSAWFDKNDPPPIVIDGARTLRVGILSKEGGTWSKRVLPDCNGQRGLKIDTSGVQHALCVTGSNTDQIKYLSSANGWTLESIGVSSWPILGVGPDGIPHVAYETTGGVNNVVWATRNLDGTWTTETAATNRDLSSSSASVRIGPDGTAYLLTRDSFGLQNYLEVKAPGGSWTETLVPGCGGVDFDFDVTSSGDIHIACESGPSTLYYTTRIAGVWRQSLVSTDRSDVVKIVVNSDGSVGILTVFHDSQGVSVGYASLTPAGWVRERVGPSFDVDRSRSIDMALDPLGRPHIAYTITSFADENIFPNGYANLHYATPIVSALPVSS